MNKIVIVSSEMIKSDGFPDFCSASILTSSSLRYPFTSGCFLSSSFVSLMICVGVFQCFDTLYSEFHFAKENITGNVFLYLIHLVSFTAFVAWPIIFI